MRRALAVMMGFGLCLAAPAAFAEVYSWRTEDGGYAYTDDKDQIPARYAKQARALPSTSLDRYERFTPQDGAAASDYAARLEQRLERLRAMNAGHGASRAPHAAVAAAPVPQNTLSLSTGNDQAPEIQVPTGGGNGPIVIEPVNAKRAGDSRTRRVTVVRQGGETLAVIKGNPHVYNVATDIYDEEDLVEGEPID
ncbi:MAG: DUF4124 domain-containing protein [Myxococcota bacterium]